MKTALIDLHYLPSIEYFCALLPFEKIILEKHEHYIKQSYHNRCYILGANKIERLVVPLKSRDGKTSISAIEIDHQQKWLNLHWRSIQSAYGRAPYFIFYAEMFEAIFRKEHRLLYDLNLELLTLCLKIIGLNKDITESTSYQNKTDEHIALLRNQISPKRNWQERGFYKPKPYIQVFGNKFVPNLSILDLIFCEGKHAVKVLQQSAGNLNIINFQGV
ncbi:MAG TPA: WbqC family protein [Cyclobacteriaceae bacterium]|nr:WbqC family protein [Cyclobacteriaceae bacterium]